MLTASIVLYHNDKAILDQAVQSFLSIPQAKRLYLIDNSNTAIFKDAYKDDEVSYIHTGNNLGFGKGHNYILEELKLNSSFHLILNPDAYFDESVVPEMMKFMRTDNSIGVMGPKILFPDGTLQPSIRKFPDMIDLIIRKAPGLSSIFKKKYMRSHYLDLDLSTPTEVDTVSGCFQLFRSEVFTKINGFDTRYFMYMEDLDICREVKIKGYKVVYFPNQFVYHYFAKESSKKFKLLRMHISSIIKYYTKWYIK